MSDQTLDAEAVGSLILLRRQGTPESSTLGIRPAVLAAHLSAAKLYGDANALRWKGHRFQAPLGKAFISTRATTSVFTPEVYEPLMQGLKAQLRDRLDTAIAEC